MNPTPATTSRPNRRPLVRYAVAGAAALVILAVYGAMRKGSNVPADQQAEYFMVTPMDLDVKISKDGELAAINNIDIFSEVEGATNIQTLVKEGTTVKKGDTLVTLDSSNIRQKIDDTTLAVQRAEADLVTAREMLEIQKSQNAANLEAAEVALNSAKIDLKAYNEGVYPQRLANAKTTLDMARISLKNTEEDLRQTNELFNKGFVTASDVKTGELNVTKARNAVEQAATDLKVLTEYTHEQDSAAKMSAVSQSEQKLVRTQRESASNLAQKTADLAAKDQGLALQKRMLEHLKDQLASCTILAPADGLVVYFTSQDRNAQQSLQEGAAVRERQLILRLPDTATMKAVVRINEQQVPRLREGMRASVRIPGIIRPLGATLTKISVLSDSSQRWWNPDLKEYPVDLELDETPKTVKPGNGCSAEIFLTRLTGVQCVKLACIYSAGDETYVFVKDGESARPVRVKVGEISDTHAQIKDGVTAGTSVLVLRSGEGRDLLEKAGIKVQPATKPGDGAGPGRKGGGGGNRGGGRNANPGAESAPATGAPPSSSAAPVPPGHTTPAPAEPGAPATPGADHSPRMAPAGKGK